MWFGRLRILGTQSCWLCLSFNILLTVWFAVSEYPRFYNWEVQYHVGYLSER